MKNDSRFDSPVAVYNPKTDTTIVFRNADEFVFASAVAELRGADLSNYKICTNVKIF